MAAWFVQVRPNHQGVAEDVEALQELGIQVNTFEVEPFTNTVSIDRGLVGGIVRGSVQAIGGLRGLPGVFLRSDAANSCETWVRGNGDAMLNAGGFTTTWRDLMYRRDGRAVHVRPLVDLKAFAGTVVKDCDFEGTFAHLERRGYRPRMDQRVFVSEYKPIVDEFRVAVVYDYAFGRQTRSRQNLVPGGAFMSTSLVEQCMALIRQAPHEVYVADFARLASGELKIVEFNCFNCSGWSGHNLLDMYYYLNQVTR